jgi:hypothetical protein
MKSEDEEKYQNIQNYPSFSNSSHCFNQDLKRSLLVEYFMIVHIETLVEIFEENLED